MPAKKSTFPVYEGGDLEAMIFAGNYYQWIIDIIRPHVGKRIVEVGAGSGSFASHLAKLKPKELTLLEPSVNMSKLLKDLKFHKSTKLNVRNDYLKGSVDFLKQKKPDTFVYVNVFEHIKHDKKEILHVADVLSKDGSLIIFVPALPGLLSNFDRTIGHHRRYTKKSLRKLCESAGFEIVNIRYMDMPGILPWWMSFIVLKRTKLVPSLVSTYDSMCIPIIRFFESLMPAPVGKNLLVVAKKKD